jgi:hypothetical protein
MIDVNKLCVCGSGQRFADCHGRPGSEQSSQAKDLLGTITERYTALVVRTHPAVGGWPIVTGCNLVNARYGAAMVLRVLAASLRN